MQITESTACLDTYAAHARDRAMFQREFCRRIAAEPGFAGEKLDIGCGGDVPETLKPIREQLGRFDGVDPSPAVHRHPQLNSRWEGAFETADIPSGKYDLAYANNVVEHIGAAEPFFRQLRRVLKPNGVFWAVTPHAKHPFAYCVRFVQWFKLKGSLASRNVHLNDYPAYYRLNRKSDIVAAAQQCGFTRLELIYMPSMQWDHYFPKPLRFIPHLYDRLIGLRRPGGMLLLAYRLQ